MQSLRKVVNALCADIGTPRALAVKLLLEHDEWEQLLQLQTLPKNYFDSESYFLDAAVSGLLRKLEVEVPGRDLESEARSKFKTIELANARTNARLSPFLDAQGPFAGPGDLAVLEVFSDIRKEIDSILGAIPRDLTPLFGPGSTYNDRGALTTVPDKLESRPTITRNALCILPLWEGTAWQRSVVHTRYDSSPEIVRGDRFTTAPKDGLRRRGICIQPSLNGSYQLPVGKAMRSRIKTGIGIDLTSAQDVHRRLARQASRDGKCATIDMTDASDLIAYVVPRLLIPRKWFELLDSLRTPFTQVGGVWHRIEKFSAMGNGYTFELETLLFAAMCKVVAARCSVELMVGVNFSVFGDDIIVPTALYQPLVALLKFLGMRPNEKKSFFEGPFRESCGGDYYDGVAVRPYHLKELPNEPQSYFALANGIRRNWRQAGPEYARERYFARARHRCFDPIPGDLRRLRGPDVLGDLVINDDQNWTTRPAKDDPVNQLEIKVLRPYFKKLSWAYWPADVQLASALYGCSSEGISPRRDDDPDGYRKAWIPLVERCPSVVTTPV